MGKTLHDLRRQGYSETDLALARHQQEANRRAGAPPRSLGEILAGQLPRPRPDAAPEDLTARQLRRRGRYGQAALLADQEALAETDELRAIQAREAALKLKELACGPGCIEFDIFRGNVMTSDQYHDAIRARLLATKASPAERALALAVLQEIKRWMGWQVFTCTKTAIELGELLGFDKTTMSDTLALLEQIGAIGRVKRGRIKVITVTPEGAFRGKIDNHAEVVEHYRAEVAPAR
jgi:hypothetical protein